MQSLDYQLKTLRPKRKTLEVDELLTVIALSVFYRAVVLQFRGVSDFGLRLQRASVGRIRIGSAKIGEDDFGSMRRTINAFQALISAAAIPLYFLDYADVAALIRMYYGYKRKSDGSE